MENAVRKLDVTRDSRDQIALALAEIALATGPAIMAIYGPDCASQAKSDGSPVTEADHQAEAIIHAGLTRIAPDIPVVAEEAAAAGAELKIADRFFLVDPLDGTREFLKHNGEFTVNIALVCDGAPCAGVVYAPALARLWVGGDTAWTCRVEVGAPLPVEAERQALVTRAAPENLVALASRSHRDSETEAFLERIRCGDVTSAGSSLKFCVVAEGEADVYPRFGPTMEWDTAAGDAVLRAAGGIVLQRDGAAFVYGKTESGLRNGAFVAWGDPKVARRYR